MTPADPRTLEELERDVRLREADRDQLVAEIAEINGRLARLEADFANYRRHSAEYDAGFAEYADMGYARQMLPVLDDFERAGFQTGGPEYAQGMELIHKRFAQILAQAQTESS